MTLSGDATHAHTILSDTAGTLAQIMATTITDSYVTYTDMIVADIGGDVNIDCTGAGGGTFAAGGNTFNDATIEGVGAYTLNITGVNDFATLTMNAPSGTLELDAAQDITDIVVTSGTFDFNNQTCTTETLSSTGTSTRAILMGTGTLTVDGIDVGKKWDFTIPTNLTFTHENSTIVFTNASTTAQIFAGGGQTYNDVTIGGAGNYALTISGDNTFADLAIDRSVTAKTLTLTSGSTQTITTLVIAVNGVVFVTINSTTPGTPGNIIKAGGGTFDGDFLDITD